MNKDVKTIEIEFEEDFNGMRLDKAISKHILELSRSDIKDLIKNGQVVSKHSNTPLKNQTHAVSTGDVIIVSFEPETKNKPKGEDIDFDILHEDADIMVINKPIDLVVHPGAGNPSGTLVNGLIKHTNGQLSDCGDIERPGIVHRLDKDTSGVMLIAKTNMAHQSLVKQIKKRRVKRYYTALVWGMPTEREGTIKTYYGRSPHDRIKMAVLDEAGKKAVTHYKVDKAIGLHFALIRCQLETGRTHQIRVHMNYIGHGVVGDQAYKPQNLPALFRRINNEQILAIKKFRRQALHATDIVFEHPVTKKEMHFSASLDPDFQKLIKVLSN